MRKHKACRKAIGTRAPILIEPRATARWSLDFVHDQFACGRRFRVLNVVIRPLSSDQRRTRAHRGAQMPRGDPEHISRGPPRGTGVDRADRAPRQAWDDFQRQRHRADLERDLVVVRRAQGRMAPHRAGQAGAERVCRKRQRIMRDEFLNETLLRNLAHARDLIAAWVADYNTETPHSALGYQTPAGFALHLTTAIARPAARDEGSARRAIAQPMPKGVNRLPAPVAAG